MWLLTWEQLHRELLLLIRAGQQARWVVELAELLADHRGVGAFDGFAGESFPSLARYEQAEHWGREWREQRVAHAFVWDVVLTLQAWTRSG